MMMMVLGCAMMVSGVVAQDDDHDSRLLGGQTTIFNDTPNAFGQPAPGLDRWEELYFFVGNSFFNMNWVQAPASTTARDGLGPLFNSRSCAGCHFKDGRGRPPEFEGEAPTGFLLRLSLNEQVITGAPMPEAIYGGQFQTHSIEGLDHEGDFRIEYTEIVGTYPDGTPYSLHQPIYTLENLNYGAMSGEVLFSPRVANQMIGLGLLEAIPEATLLSHADPNDRDGDGISGRPNIVWDVLNSRQAIGRFGWKANQPHLLQQVAAAFNGDMGITTRLFPQQNCTAVQTDCLNAISGADPEVEISDDDLLKTVLYASALAVPAQRDSDTQLVQQGRELFEQVQCSACHVPTLQTGLHPTIPALSYQTIHPYTDLLLHDMGDGLADGRPDFEASGSEWRTPPLWGIGLIETVNGHTYYLHDGRARSLEEAILWHGGESEASRDAYMDLSAAERAALLAFLESL
jgi:CxxC motif-containing protein (DUF1111 family)